MESKEEQAELTDPAEAGSIPTGTLRWLNLMGDLAHVVVALLLIVMTVLVLIYATFAYAHQMPLLVSALHSQPAMSVSENHPADPFIVSSIEFLSNILFAVILLEVLHTTLIFLHDRSSRPVIRAFLVVAILSIVRKLLLVGAESSLTGEKGLVFIYSSSGSLISIIGIMVLVFCLVYINRAGERRK